MAILPPYSQIDLNWSSTQYPPDNGDLYWTRYYTKGGSHPPAYEITGQNLRFNIPTGVTGDSWIKNQIPFHHTADGTFSAHHMIAIFGPYYAYQPGPNNVQMMYRIEGLTNNKWMQIRIELMSVQGGQGNGQFEVYFEDSEGMFADHYDIREGFGMQQGEQLNLYFYLYGDGTCQLRMYDADRGYWYDFTVTSGLFAYEEELAWSLTWEVNAAQTKDNYLDVLYHDFNTLVYGVWTDWAPSFEELDTDTGGWVGTNEELVPLGGWLKFQFDPAEPDYNYTEFLQHFEYCTDYDESVTEDPTVTASTPRTIINYDYQNPAWIVRSKFAIPWKNSYFLWNSSATYRCYVGLINQDGTRYLRFGYSSAKLALQSHLGTELDTDPSNTSNYSTTSSTQIQWIQINAGVFTMGAQAGSVFFSYANRNLYDYFEPEDELYLQVFISSVSYDYTYLYYDWEIRSPVFPPNPDYGQGSGASMFCEMQSLEVPNEWTTALDEYVMYYRTKIFNPEDYDDEQSLKAIDPHYPSDIGFALRERDACIVKDQYNRWYFYQVVPGDEVDDLPHKMRITDQVYWKLIDYTGQDPRYKAEQYDVVGLVSGNSVLVTHTEHDTSLSPAPCFQIIHDGRVKTDEIIVTLVSSTQLRLTTEVATAFTDLKINIYLTAAP